MKSLTCNRRPHWLKVSITGNEEFYKVKQLIHEQQLHTVCQSARCPNRGECWSRRTATFMILGDKCTRNCGFCAVSHDQPLIVDYDEPRRVATAVKKMGLAYAVITSVTRDDLSDGGAGHFARTIEAIKSLVPSCKVEVLLPDFAGCIESLCTVLSAKPDILNHNLETVPSLYPRVRPQSFYRRSLQLLNIARQKGACTKSGIMLGLGETIDEVHQTMKDLRQVDCQIVTLGQYLPPSRKHLPVVNFITPEAFISLQDLGLEMGFVHVEAAPLVRSSYHAEKQALKSLINDDTKPL